jgi:hypothetical protein
MSDLVIEHEQKDGGGSWFIALDGRRVGEMVYEAAASGPITIVHTEVGPELRGRGAGLELVAAGVAWAREHGRKVIPRCPFARATIAKHPELQDVVTRS